VGWFSELPVTMVRIVVLRMRRFLARRGVMIVGYRQGSRIQRLTMIERVRDHRALELTACDASQLVAAVMAARKIPGALAEVGVAYGASARLITDTCPGKVLHLFDTFSGLPMPKDCDSAKFKSGQYACSLESVQKYLGTRAVVFHKGLFPVETGKDVSQERFSFVHLDGDLYQSTIDSLGFFYPRMSPGGMLLSHDYLTSDGVTRAFSEFFADKPEAVLELIGHQCLVVKCTP
jgi:O-methyltransferase